MQIIAVMGKAGSGKSTLSQQLAEALGYAHISTGQLARDHISGNWSELGMMSPEKEMRRVFEQEVDKLRHQGYEGIVVDGMPRKQVQVRYMVKEVFRQDSLTWVSLIINDTVSIKRLLDRKREDDTDEAIFTRIELYNINQTSIETNILSFGHGIIKVDATKQLENIIADIMEEL